MKIINQDLKKGIIKIQTQNLDDLWYLSTIIDPDDLVSGKTFRKIKKQTEGEKSKDATKKPVFLKALVEKVEFSKYTNVLRVSGVIKEGPDDVPHGEHHTFNVDENTQITIQKQKWLKYQIDKLKEAASDSKSSVLICVHDREEAFFALFKKYGTEILSNIKGNVAKKREENKKIENFYVTILEKIKEYEKRYKINQIVIASPAFWKEELSKELKDEDLKKKIIFSTCSSVSKNAINEVVKRPEMKNALKQERFSKEMNKIEELLDEISKENLAVYGLKEVKSASEMGAIKDLLVTDSMIQKTRQDGTYSKIDSIMKEVDKNRGSIEIISSEHEGGKKLDGLGGIAGILRFKVS